MPANSTAVPVCGQCHITIQEDAIVTVCRRCDVTFHLVCTGTRKVSKQYGCGKCYTVPGNAPIGKIKRSDLGRDEGGARGGPGDLSGSDVSGNTMMDARTGKGEGSICSRTSRRSETDQSLRDFIASQTALIKTLVATRAEPSAPDKGTGAVPKVKPAAQREGEEKKGRANISRHREEEEGSSGDESEFVMDITQARNASDFKRCLEIPERDGHVTVIRLPPPLPRFGGDAKEWPAFITNYVESSRRHKVTDVDNMARLRVALYGRAAAEVEGNLLHAASLPEVLDSLRRSFGNAATILQCLEEGVRAVPKINNDGVGLQLLSIRTSSLVNTMLACGLNDELRTCSLVNTLQTKLPCFLAVRWGEFRGDGVASVVGFNSFLKREVGYLLNAGQDQIRVEEPVANPVETVSTVRSMDGANTRAPNSSSTANNVRVCLVCSSDHPLVKCTGFAAMTPAERLELTTKNRICYKCLRTLSGYHRCRYATRCDKCNFAHHPLMHDACALRFSHPVSTTVDARPALFKITPVTLSHNGTSVKTFVFFDEGSSVSLMDPTLIEELGLAGEAKPLTIKWTDGQWRTDANSKTVDVTMTAPGCEVVLKGVRTLTDWDLSTQTLTADTIGQLFPEGGGPAPYTNGKVRLLLGLPQAHLVCATECRENLDAGLIAANTRLGWIIYGGGVPGARTLGFNYRVCHTSTVPEGLDKLIHSFFDTESFGVRPAPHKQGAREQRALDILKRTVRRVDGRYEAGLLWASDNPCLPDSRGMCERRAVSLQRRMAKDPVLATTLEKVIQGYVEKGYAREVGATPARGPLWYLPMFPVVNRMKPDKARMVSDAAACVEGVCLNTFLLTGPDLLVALPEVLVRFRERKVAATADACEMYHRVFVRVEDRDAQRFLWLPVNAARAIEMRMEVMTFGATCSPAIAQYVKNVNADLFEKECPEAVFAIKHLTYMDDFLGSYDSKDQAKRVMEDIIRIQLHAGFQMKKWRSSDPSLLEDCKEAIGTDKEFYAPEGRILGMLWRSADDSLGFSTDHISKMQEKEPVTHLVILCGVMALYDPDGLGAHVVIKGKIILRECWRAGGGFNKVVTDSIRDKWLAWCKSLPDLDSVHIPRFVGLIPTVPWDIHTFVDASELAFAAAVYVRGLDSGGNVCCRLVMAKTRVAPLRRLSIPRVELQAAVLGARLAKTVGETLTVAVGRRVFWSDSTNALKWIKSSHRRYHSFVASRVDEILNSSDENEWRWVPTAMNVADDATRMDSPTKNERWFNGPAFLYSSEDAWPVPDEIDDSPAEEELLPVMTMSEAPPSFGLAPDPARFSSWRRLVRTTAFGLRFFFRKVFDGSPFTSEELLRAEEELFRSAQQVEYGAELTRMISNPKYTLQKRHTLYKVCPVVDEKRILRVNGRLPASFPEHVRCPIILPSKSRVTSLLVEHMHKRFLHGNHETVINELRGRFYVPGLRALVRSVASACLGCRIIKPNPRSPQMGSLIEGRVACGWRAFTYCGVDYFGPIEVVIGRRREKRWIALFTCLTTRAIYLTIAFSLSTDSFLMCLRGLVSDHDVIPLEMRSDNGTNFTAAVKELHRVAEQYPEMKWVFNPPGAPHMGGCWERMVRTVKRGLNVVIGPDPYTDETLLCTAKEVQWVVNCHPLTHVALGPEDADALTPHDFLHGGSRRRAHEGVGLGDLDTKHLRKSWRRSQQVADHFWRRFAKEVVPTLNLRTKWFELAEPLAVGDIVMVAEEARRGLWRRGIVTKVFPDATGKQVRKVAVRTSSGEIVRPAVKVAKVDSS